MYIQRTRMFTFGADTSAIKPVQLMCICRFQGKYVCPSWIVWRTKMAYYERDKNAHQDYNTTIHIAFSHPAVQFVGLHPSCLEYLVCMNVDQRGRLTLGALRNILVTFLSTLVC